MGGSQEIKMNIHHTHKKQAEKIGTILEEHGSFIRATWPMRNVHIFSQDAKAAVQQIAAVQRIIRGAEERGIEMSVLPSISSPSMVHILIGGIPGTEIKTPIMWLQDANLYEGAPSNGSNTEASEMEPTSPEASVEEGEEVPTEPEEKKSGSSVVKQEYRARYAEAGHPSNCGDELAQRLDNLVKPKHTNLDQFRQICEANGVDLSKLNTTNHGWQGRYRMTGRNMLAKKVYSNGGVLLMPEGWGVEPMRMSADWMAAQRFVK